MASIVDKYKSLPNLLIWETAHEPDGNSDPFNGTQNSYELIYQMDGYHPVSIVLNCENYYFSPYVVGADIVLEVRYPPRFARVRQVNRPFFFRMPIHSVSMRRFHRCGTRRVHETLATADAITARAA